jgi:hypothetical protein
VHRLFEISLDWQLSFVLAAVAVVVTIAARRARERRWTSFVGGFGLELAIIFVLYGTWQIAGSFSPSHVTAGMHRARWIWDAERVLRMPSEAALQRHLLPHPGLVKLSNSYYALLHTPPLAVLLVWLYVFHRDNYRSVRNTVVFTTGICLLIQFVPVAPPRLVPAFHMVDTAHLYNQSVYGAIGTGIANQLSAMPSVHIAWAVIIGLAAVRYGTSRWRWLVLTHPIVMWFVVALTANHFWLDGMVAIAVLAVVLAAQSVLRRLVREPAVVRPLGDVGGDEGVDPFPVAVEPVFVE